MWTFATTRQASRLACAGPLLGLLALLSGCGQTLEITPTQALAAAGTTLQLAAATLHALVATDVTSQVSWSSSNSAVATVSSAGLVSALSPGTATISASLSGSTASMRLTVTLGTLVSVEVTPANPSLPNGFTEQFTAIGVFSDNSTQDLTQQVTWSSSSPAVARVSNSAGMVGLASAASTGTTTLTASSGSISGSTTLTVTSATLVSIQVTPANPSTPKGVSQPFTATAIFSDNSTQNLTTQVTWASSNSTVATISNAAGSQGLASSAAAGSTTISATSGAISGSTTLTVTSATLVSIAVTPATPSIANGLTEQFTATGIYTDNSTQNLTTQVIWASSNPVVATISNAAGSQGLASSAAAGSTTISATSGAISGGTTLTVTSATLVSIAVTPATPSIANGLTEQFIATGTYTDNSTQNLTTQITWSSSDTSVATVSNASGSQGLASSGAVGSTMISATSGSISGSTTFTVTSATLVSIAVTPATPRIANGLTEQFTATGTYTDNSTQNLTTQVTWSSSDTGVASVSNATGSQGLASSSAVGSSTVSATSGSLSGSTTLAVSAATLVSITVTPANPNLANGLTEQFTATGTYTDNSTQNLTTQVTWLSSDTAVATISNASGSQGLASSAALGSTTISATLGSVSGNTALTIEPCAAGFTECESITIDHTQVGNSDSSNFPMLFSGTYAYLATVGNGGQVQNTVTQQGISVPADAVFTADSGCTMPLNWEVESYDPASGAVNLWVQIPTLSHTTNTVIYLCVGNASVTSFLGGAQGAVWDSNYQAVYHFPNAPMLSLSDSTSNENNLTNDGGTATFGPVDGAVAFNGSGQYASGPLSYAFSSMTVELWCLIESMPSSNSAVIASRGADPTSAYYPDFWIELYPSNPVFWFTGSDGAPAGYGASVPTGNWVQLVGVNNGSTMTLYVNGSAVGSASISGLANNFSTLNLAQPDSYSSFRSGYFDGDLDEVRVSSTARSADWITASYNSQSSPSTFYTVTAN